ncbi:MAG TPA: FtsK/SpoIIIE domain-containing protein [Anaerolineales bacterium]|nr:FtsK/SpoIIIE domain-containing protein [Anaerolineales bacterium]
MAGPNISFRRGQRQWKQLPAGNIAVPAYPNEPSRPGALSWWLTLAPVLGIVVMSFGFGFLYGNFTYSFLISGASMVYPAVMLLRQREQLRRWREDKERIEQAYARRIEEVQLELSARRQGQSDYLNWTYPSPAELGTWAADRAERLWERRVGDPDFLDLRLGIGNVPASFSVGTPQIDIPELASPNLLKARDTAASFMTTPNVPVAARLAASTSLALCGPQQLREAATRAVLVHLAALHAPSEVELLAVLPARNISEWGWLKWLPHCRALQVETNSVNLASEPGQVRELLSGLMDRLQIRAQRPSGTDSGSPLLGPHLVLVVVDHEAVQGEAGIRRILEDGQRLGASLLLALPGTREVPEGCEAWADLESEKRGVLYRKNVAHTLSFVPDQLTPKTADRIARGLAPLEPVESGGASDLPTQIRLLDLIGRPDLDALDIESRWLAALSRPPALQVSVGAKAGRRSLVVDLKQSGHGPHGLIAGTTGSGKSELLLTLLTALALDHHPHQVNFVLVDYKGGTAMSVLADLPHTVGVVTDLDGRQTRRALMALRSEMTRREEILARHQVADIEKYHELGIAEPFPYLFIVIDEFAELRDRFKNDLGEVLSEFVSVAQKGRALGVHLILAMQKPEGVVNDSIRANMRFRICLRVERAEDSRNVLNRPDAYLLPNRPAGRAYFQVGNNEIFDMFQVARIAGFHRQDGRDTPANGDLKISEVAADGRRIPLVEIAFARTQAILSDSEARTEAQVIVEKAARAAERLQIQRLPSPWPPPLPAQVPVTQLIEKLGVEAWDGAGWSKRGSPRARLEPTPLALGDDPQHQLQEPLSVDLARDGNLLIVGAPGSGRTTALLTLVSSYVRTHSPAEINFHLIDYSGHLLQAGLAELPHVGGVYGPTEPERIRRLQSTLEAELDRRRARFADLGVANLEGYRKVIGAEDGMPALAVVINNFSGFREAFVDEVVDWTRLIREGGPYGLHFALASDRIPPTNVADLIASRIALRMADRTMYSLILGGRTDLTLYDPIPGRGFFSSKPPLEIQIALPTDSAAEDQIPALQSLAKSMRAAWSGPRPVEVRLLEEEVSLAAVLAQSGGLPAPAGAGRLTTWIGLDDEQLLPVELDLTKAGSYFLVSGPPESGRTTALATLVAAFGWQVPPTQLHVALVTPNRAERYPLDPLRDIPHVLGHAKSAKTLERLLERLEAEVQARSAGEGTGALAARILVLIDDYHLLGGRVEPDLMTRLEGLARRGADSGVTTAITIPSTVLTSLADPLVRQAKAWRSGIWLRSTDLTETSSLGLRLPTGMRGKALPPGRGFLYDPAAQTLLQVASPEFSAAGETDGAHPIGLAAWAAAIRKRWESHEA